MNISFVCSVLLNAVLATVKIERLYVLGDSVSDSNGLVKLMQDPFLLKKYFPNGKLTDGDLWVEILRSRLNVVDYQNYAVIGATSDNVTFPGKLYFEINVKFIKVNLLDARGIPGCIQQADKLIQYLKEKENIDRDSTLVTMLFFGNDFFLGSNPDVFVSKMLKCVDMVAATNLVGQIIITSTVGIKYSPYTKKDLIKEIAEREKASTSKWNQELASINYQLNNTKIYDMDFKSKPCDDIINIDFLGVIETAIENKKSQEPCFNISLLAPPVDVPDVCDNPSFHVFYDQFHPTSYVHGLMADKVVQMLEL